MVLDCRRRTIECSCRVFIFRRRRLETSLLMMMDMSRYAADGHRTVGRLAKMPVMDNAINLELV